MATRPQRAYYRIRNPVGERPRLAVGGRSAEVLDVAEYRLSFVAGELGEVDEGQRLWGTLHIGDRWTVEVDGDVVRTREAHAAVRLRSPIPFKIILDEQLYLRAHYARE
ncbi:MAG TPA: hypothetical protein VE173_03400 [Longimicrobiales bacterium]|jgi:hypothetical protein|nr:hypothetical protein [Longimicrobiales bacterium]